MFEVRLEEFLDDMRQVDDFGVGLLKHLLVKLAEDQRSHMGRVESTERLRFVDELVMSLRVDGEVLQERGIYPAEPFAWKIEDEELLTEQISHQSFEAIAENNLQLGNSQLAYSELGYPRVLSGWTPVRGYGAIRGSGG